MAASLSLTQLSSGNPLYDKYYQQVDPSGSGRVAAADAALFLKRSGLADLVLGKIWDLADSERKGCLNKQQFFIALRLVACAQNGLEVTLKSLNLAVPPPKFHDTSSPLLPGGVSIDGPWVVKTEEKLKFDAIFDSLSPVGGMLSGEKVKPVLLNSKLPVDVLGRVWELSDLDRDGMLDRDEFAVVMYLVYRALEGEPVPMSLPATLVPPSKRKKPPVSVPPVMPLLPSPPSIKERRSSHSGSKTLPSKPAATPVTWAVSPPDIAKYDEVFAKTDLDMDGLVSGPEVRDIFLKTGLPSATLARIWELCDIGDIGKLTREQFALALHLINQKLTTGVNPPQNLSPEMIPPSDRLSLAAKQSNAANLAADFSAIKELDSLSNEIVDLQKEKSSVEQDIKENEESIRERTSEVQDLQNEVQKESGVLHRLQSQRQEVQDALEELDQQKTTLEEQLGHIRQQCSHENQRISSLEAEHAEQEQRIEEYEEQLVQAREELLRLQEETQQLEEKVQAAREQLTPLRESVRDSFSQVSQVQQKLSDLQLEERTVTAQLSWKMALEEDPVPVLVNGSANEPHPEDQAEELRVEPPAIQPQMEPAEPIEEVEEDRPKAPEEPVPKSDAFKDLYNSLSSTAWPVPRDNLVKEHISPVAFTLQEQRSPTSEVVEEQEEESFKASTPKQVESPEPERRPESTEPPQATPPALPPQTTPPPLPAQPTLSPTTSPPPLPGMDFFQSDPFTDHDPFKDDPFGKADVSYPFGGDPFKGTDPFAADSFFKQSLAAPFPSADPFTLTDPFSESASLADPDLFAAPLNNAAGLDPFSSKPNNKAARDPFSAKVNNVDADQFGSKMDSLAEPDPFGSQGTAGPDPFSCSQPGSELPADLTAAPNDPFAPGGTAVKTGSDPDPFAAVFGNESFGQGFADFSALAKSNSSDPFASSNSSNNSQPSSPDVPPALPPKTGTPTRPPPPPPGKRSSISRSESSDSFHRRGPFLPQGSGDPPFSQPAKDAAQDPFAPSSPRQPAQDPDRFASFDKHNHRKDERLDRAPPPSDCPPPCMTSCTLPCTHCVLVSDWLVPNDPPHILLSL
ncbi:epidermal growth factor receptor substrate 15 isoform X2 [Coregonus clupeaformis]|uniref:epidermal growth factor receptor substrate 15 isoform X2 n=1 Tax=Coregonus clupeaformis TaxID=59861 RepID=UPI001E1C3F32|nr:epidermal growth factor receptor substrate 15 isoform X2 [Coregonus clupeaformis]